MRWTSDDPRVVDRSGRTLRGGGLGLGAVVSLLSLIWAEIATPSGQVGPLSAAYRRAVEGVAHAVLGAAFCAPLGLWGLAAALPVAAVYWRAKEAGDLRRGGRLWDGAEDAVMVALGAWYGGPWWPALMLGCAAYIMASAAWRRLPGPGAGAPAVMSGAYISHPGDLLGRWLASPFLAFDLIRHAVVGMAFWLLAQSQPEAFSAATFGAFALQFKAELWALAMMAGSIITFVGVMHPPHRWAIVLGSAINMVQFAGLCYSALFTGGEMVVGAYALGFATASGLTVLAGLRHDAG